jgi:hypothetical protein
MAEPGQIETALLELLQGREELAGQPLEHAGPFTDADYAPGNDGVVLRLGDGSEFHLSIIRVRAG